MKIRDIITEQTQDEVDEALRSFDTVGDMTQPDQAFRSKQAQWVASPGQQLKTQKFFEKTPYEFRIFVSNIKPSYMHYGEIDQKTLAEFLGPQAAAQIMSDTQNAITVVYAGNNKALGQIPLTPWIMAHKLGHIMQSEPRIMGIFAPAFKKASDYLYVTADKILNNCYGQPFRRAGIWGLGPGRNNSEDYEKLWRALGTMRSARKGEVTMGEFKHELFAQYIHSGTITFNPLPQTLGDLTLKPDCPDYLPKMASDMSKFFETQLGRCVGRVFMMTEVSETPTKRQYDQQQKAQKRA